MNINLHIDKLVLEGVDIAPGQSRLLQRIVAAELTRMLSDGELSPSLVQGSSLSRLAAGNIQLREDNDTGGLGRQIAQSVYGGLGRE